MQRFLKALADVFVPILPALVAAGLLMGLNNVLTDEGLFIKGQSLIEVYPKFTDLAEMINTFSSAAFTFLPVLIGFSATKIFGGTVPVWNILGVEIAKVGYQGTVLPVIVSSFIIYYCRTYYEDSRRLDDCRSYVAVF